MECTISGLPEIVHSTLDCVNIEKTQINCTANSGPISLDDLEETIRFLIKFIIAQKRNISFKNMLIVCKKMQSNHYFTTFWLLPTIPLGKQVQYVFQLAIQIFWSIVLNMLDGENKRKHLQLIQDIITRMGGNSFLLKGWSISIITALIGLALTSNSDKDRVVLLIIATILIAMFWLLDSYYLSQERMYRGLFTEVRKKSEDQIDYSLDSRHHNIGYNTWLSSTVSNVFLIFYAPVLLLLLLICANLVGINIYLK